MTYFKTRIFEPSSFVRNPFEYVVVAIQILLNFSVTDEMVLETLDCGTSENLGLTVSHEVILGMELPFKIIVVVYSRSFYLYFIKHDVLNM